MINEILYQLLKERQLLAVDPMYVWLMSGTDHLDQLESAAAAFECRLTQTKDCLYLFPSQDNQFLGYSKADLKAVLIKSNQNDVHYYLSMFALLVLLDMFYSTEYGGGRVRTFLTLAEWMNRYSDALNSGLDNTDNPGNIPYERMVDTYNNLLSDMEHRNSSNNKAHIFMTLIKFLEKQKLIRYLPEDDQIYLTPRIDALMHVILSSDEQLTILDSINIERDGDYNASTQ